MTHEQWHREAMVMLITAVGMLLTEKRSDAIGAAVTELAKKSDLITLNETDKE